MAKETARRVWGAVNKMVFTPHAAAWQLASKKASTFFGLFMPETSGSFFGPGRTIHDFAHEGGYSTLPWMHPRQ